MREVEIARALREGPCPSDDAFDALLPADLRRASGRFWTPLSVAVRAAQWFGELGVRRVVDIGAGPGKFCVAAALACPCAFTGIEQRPRLVEAARALARTFGVEGRVRFVEGSFGQVATPPADAYYLFNPFGENVLDEEQQLDHDVELGDGRYLRDILAMERLLDAAPRGTCLVTYNGFGGEVPAGYEAVRVFLGLPTELRAWRKV